MTTRSPILLLFCLSSLQLIAQQSLFTWNGVTMGLDSSKGEEVLFKDETAIMLGTNGVQDAAIATQHFNPKSLSVPLQEKFFKLTILNLWFKTSTDDVQKCFPIPNWLPSMNRLESLALWDVDVTNLSTCRDLPLKNLDLRKICFGDKISLINAIGDFSELEYFIYDRTISKEDIDLLKKKLPKTQFITKDKD